MATLTEIERALQKAKADVAKMSPTAVGGNPYGGFRNVPNPDIGTLNEKIARLEKAKRIEQTKQVVADQNAPSEDRELAKAELDSLRNEARSDLRSFRKNLEQTNKDVGELLGKAVAEETKQKSIEEELDASFSVGVTPEAPKAEPATQAKPETAPPASPTAPATPAKPAPAPAKKDVDGLEKDKEELKAQRKRMREIELEREEMKLAEEKAAQRQRAYNALTPAQRLELDVRSREQKQAERARAAVSERREQLAADEEYKGMQIASSGSFKNGDVTQYVDPKERAAAQEYFTKRAADIRAGEDPAVRAQGGQFTAGPAPTFSEDRSLTVVDIHPDHGGGRGVGAKPNFASGDKFGPDPNTMAYEMIGGKPVPIMTVGQAFATQSRGPGINVYEKTGTMAQQLDALSARNIRAGAGKQAVDEMIEFASTGKRSPRAEADKKKREEADKKKREAAAAAAAEAATKMIPSDASQPYSS